MFRCLDPGKRYGRNSPANQSRGGGDLLTAAAADAAARGIALRYCRTMAAAGSSAQRNRRSALNGRRGFALARKPRRAIYSPLLTHTDAADPRRQRFQGADGTQPW
jgi:hypothetical protein